MPELEGLFAGWLCNAKSNGCYFLFRKDKSRPGATFWSTTNQSKRTAKGKLLIMSKSGLANDITIRLLDMIKSLPTVMD
nr:MAG TPA_asm: hypothetical protein [Caudoviricetes sp.]